MAKPLEAQGSVKYTKWMITQTFTKPLWSFNTDGSLSSASTGIYASCFVAWFDFIFSVEKF